MKKYDSLKELITENKLITGLVLIIFILVVTIPLFGNVFSKTVNIKDLTYQISDNEKTEYFPGKLITSNKDTLAYSRDSNETVLERTPLYYSDTESFIVTTDMSYVNYLASTEELVPRISEVSYEGSEVMLKLDNKDRELESGFLFDGDNVYIALETIEVVVDNDTYTLPTFSYVETNNKSMTIYNYEDEEIIKIDDFDKASIKHASYSVDLNTDLLVFNNGKKQMLSTDMSRLELIK